MSKIRYATIDDFRELWSSGASEGSLMDAETVDRAAFAYLNNGKAYAIESSTGALLALVGGHIIWSGVAEAWAFVTSNAKQHRFELHRTVRVVFAKLIEANHLRRVETNILVGCPSFVRWALSLGFKQVGTREDFGPTGEDYYLFAWVRRWDS